MTKTENYILERIEKKIDCLDEKLGQTMEKYIIPHEEFIKNCKENKSKDDKKKENKVARIISIGIAVFSSFVAICIAIFK